MLSFILLNLATIIVGAVVLAVIAFIAVKLIVSQKKASSCTCSCAGCPSAKHCGK